MPVKPFESGIGSPRHRLCCVAAAGQPVSDLDVQHTIDGDGDVVLGDGCLVADGDGQLLEAVHIGNAVNL